jgi:hypothetical protein
MSAKPPPKNLREAATAFVPHLIRCAICREAPATRERHGRRTLGEHTGTAQILVCDTCEEPESFSPLARYDWFHAHDLPYASALRALLFFTGPGAKS